MAKSIDEATRAVLKKRHVELFRESLNVDDDLGCVLRATVLIEAALREYIEDAVETPSVLKDEWSAPSLGMEWRLKWARALGLALDERTIDALNTLKNFRNDLAHRLGTELNEKRVNDFFGRLDLGLQSIVRERMKTLRERGWKRKLRQTLLIFVTNFEAIVDVSKPSFNQRVRAEVKRRFDARKH